MDLRATCLNCMDGRVQLPVLYWIKENYKVDFVDVITEAGMDGVLAKQENIEEVLRSISISVEINKSSKLFVAGHYDCRGNPADEKTHQQHVRKAVARLKKYRPGHEIVGLWVDQDWQVKIVPLDSSI